MVRASEDPKIDEDHLGEALIRHVDYVIIVIKRQLWFDSILSVVKFATRVEPREYWLVFTSLAQKSFVQGIFVFE
ncbi:MAG: hypothetical protein MJ172_03255 [Clostridia bacterium]|nr:hypothetical protein [Clostridia bacterium]